MAIKRKQGPRETLTDDLRKICASHHNDGCMWCNELARRDQVDPPKITESVKTVKTDPPKIVKTVKTDQPTISRGGRPRMYDDRSHELVRQRMKRYLDRKRSQADPSA